MCMDYIYCYDNPKVGHPHCQVRFYENYIDDWGQTRRKSIGFKQFGYRVNDGRERAIKKAKEWRDAKAKELNKPIPAWQRNYFVHEPRSNTGVSGVSLCHVLDKRKKYTYYRERYTVTWVENGVKKNKQFTFDWTSEAAKKAAFKTACAYRKEMKRIWYKDHSEDKASAS